MIDTQCTKLFVIMNNTDRTEGRGEEYVYGITEYESTAERIAKGNYVQGTNCPILTKYPLIVNGLKYFPFDFVPLIPPSCYDLAREEEIKEKRKQEVLYGETVNKALSLGLTKEDIEVLHSAYT